MLVVRIWEGLGNQMFQYAYAKSLQQKTDLQVFLEGRRIYKNVLPGENLIVERKCDLVNFNLKLKFIKTDYLSKWKYLEQGNIVQKIHYVLAKKGFGDYIFLTDDSDEYAYHKNLLNLHKNCYVMGHFLNKKYFESLRKELLEDFTLKRGMVIPNELKNKFINFDTVSVHIRRGDYLYIDFAKVVCNEMERRNYYQKAMSYMVKNLSKPLFLFFSDDIEWVKENFLCPYEHCFISGMGFTNCEEMMLMSLCKHNIIANSTFSFWGAWLNQNEEKKVIFPKNWLPSIIPQGWIKM